MNSINPILNPLKKRNQCGSALFIIMIGLALFAALSYAVSKMLSGGSNTGMISEEQAKLDADEIIDYARTVRAAIQDLQISNNCSDEDISFENDAVPGYDHSPVAPDKCKVFGSSGAGMTWRTPQQGAVSSGTYFFTGLFRVADVPDAGSTGADLVMALSNVQGTICKEINKKLDVNGGVIPREDDSTAFTTKFQDTYGAGAIISVNLSGIRAGCFEDKDTAGKYHFYQVLIAR